MRPLEELTLAALLHRTAAACPQCDAVWYKGRIWSYARLERETGHTAAQLLALGVQKGDHVALWGELDPEMLTAFYAVQCIGGVAVMLNTSLGQEELTPLLEAADVRFFLVGRSYKASRSLEELAGRMVLPACVEACLSIGPEGIAGCRSLRALPPAPAQAVRQAEQAVTPQDTAVILFTSGSTGRPKAVMSSHYSRVNSGIQQAHDLRACRADRFCVTMPMFHCFCISVNLIASLAVGACLCIPADRHTASITDTVERCGCTILSSVPTMYYALIGKKEFVPQRLATLRTGIIGGAYYPPEDFVRIDRAIGPQFTLLSSLGQTETTAGMTVSRLEDSIEVRSRTVGHFMDHVEGKIVDLKTGRTLPAGQRGEICVRGYLAMQGYYKDAEQTRRTLDAGGWVHTGDLGVLNEQGNLTLKGRIKELIFSPPRMISSCEIETMLQLLPQVAGCKVVGVPDPHYGEEICACIQRAPGVPLEESEVKRHLLLHLADYKMPRYILFWPDLPKTATGKLNPAACKAAACAQLGL